MVSTINNGALARIVEHIIGLQANPRISDDDTYAHAYAWAHERELLPLGPKVESPAHERLAFLKIARVATAAFLKKGVWWELRDVTSTRGIEVARISNGQAVGLCDLSVVERYGIPLRLADGTVRPDWPEYVYYLSKKIYIAERGVQVLARIPATAAVQRITFEPRPLEENERPFKYNVCHHCGQRALAFIAEGAFSNHVTCRVCGGWMADYLSYPSIIHAQEAYAMEKRKAAR